MTEARERDTRLRELYAPLGDAPATRSRARCPTADAMLALRRRDGSEEERIATLDHVMACGDCGREFELLRAIDRAADESAQGIAKREDQVVPLRERASWRRFAPYAVAASILIVAAVGVLSRGSELTRGGSTEIILVGPPLEVRGGTPLTFVWRTMPGAIRYELEVLNAAGAVVHAATSSDTVVTMAGDRLTTGREYRWWVRATTGAGPQRASEMRRLRVRIE